MKVTLISPYLDTIAQGLRCLSSFVKSKDYECEMVFLPDYRALLSYDPQFGRPYEQSLMDDVVQTCSGSDIVGICVMSNFFDRAVQLSENLREKLAVPVIWGGIHPTVSPEESLDHCDIVCGGEGEYAMLNLLRAMEQKRDYHDIKNLSFKRNGAVQKNELAPLILDLDALPFQDYDFTTHYTATKDGRRLVKMNYEIQKDQIVNGLRICGGLCVYQTITTRGCPHACAYCCHSALRKLSQGQKILRRRGTENVMQELEQVKEKMPYVELILFADESMPAMPAERLKEFCEQYKTRIGLPFFVQVSPPYMTEEKMDCLVDAGMRCAQMGIQTGSEEVSRTYYNRNIGNDEVRKGARLLNKHKDRICPPVYDIILDNPYETREDVLKTVRLLMELPRPFVVQFFSLTFYPGTELYERAKADGIIKDERNTVYRKHYHAFDKSFLNFLVMGAHFGFPKPLMKFLSNEHVAKILDRKCLRFWWRLVHKTLKSLKRLLKGH
ncbi:MAG: B12-binding domain-containing radical SAM protein [Candidatus Coatesbacteria bacterium]|nr:B12-binding domain-containing radical SAM protein [Candidatus Coatesbacteria bacterium]